MRRVISNKMCKKDKEIEYWYTFDNKEVTVKFPLECLDCILGKDGRPQGVNHCIAKMIQSVCMFVRHKRKEESWKK